jgi:O-antigen/teichoic acid export membrane protein
MNVVIEQGLLGLGEPALVMRSELTGLAVTAVSLALLLRPFGIMGAAIASMLSYATVAACLLFQSYRVTGNSAIDMLIPRIDEIRRYVERARLLLAPVRDGI